MNNSRHAQQRAQQLANHVEQNAMMRETTRLLFGTAVSRMERTSENVLKNFLGRG